MKKFLKNAVTQLIALAWAAGIITAIQLGFFDYMQAVVSIFSDATIPNAAKPTAIWLTTLVYGQSLLRNCFGLFVKYVIDHPPTTWWAWKYVKGFFVAKESTYPIK